MKAQGFTLVELLAVIVILAVLALIATPVVLSIIDDAKESAMLRSAEMYLSGVENAVMRENMNSGGNFRPNECTITNGNMTCDSTNVEVEVDGEVPSSGSITFENGKIKQVTLNYTSGTIVKDSSGNLVYAVKENDEENEEPVTLAAGIYYTDGTFKDWETLKTESKVTDTKVNGGAFMFDSTVEKVVILDGVTTIGANAFENCNSLIEVIIPQSVTSIENCAFFSNPQLIEVDYKGSQEQWGAITGAGLVDFENITINYNYSV